MRARAPLIGALCIFAHSHKVHPGLASFWATPFLAATVTFSPIRISSMRPTISAVHEQRIHALALKEGRNFQNAFERVINAGLAATGHRAAVMTPPLGDLTDTEMTEMKIPLSAALRARLREIAQEHGHSQR